MISLGGGQAKDEFWEYLLMLREMDKKRARKGGLYIPFPNFTLGDGLGDLTDGKGNYGGFIGDMAVSKAYGLGAMPGKGMYSGDKTISSAYGLNKGIDGILGYGKGISQNRLYGSNNGSYGLYGQGYKGVSFGGYGKGGSAGTGGKSGGYSGGKGGSSGSSGSGSSGGK
jgi:hypothetical protein